MGLCKERERFYQSVVIVLTGSLLCNFTYFLVYATVNTFAETAGISPDKVLYNLVQNANMKHDWACSYRKINQEEMV